MSRKAVHIAAKWLETGKVDSVNVLIPTKLMTAENVKDSSAGDFSILIQQTGD